MDKKAKVSIVFISFGLLLTSILVVTFSYINRANTTGQTGLSTTVPDNFSFNTTGNGAISLNVTEPDLDVSVGANDYTRYVSNSGGNITVTLTNTNENSNTLCNYDIVYTPSISFTSSPAAINASLNELVISGATTGNSKNFSNVPIAGTSPVILFNTNMEVATANQVVTDAWTFTIKYFNLNVPQNSILGQVPQGNITIRKNSCIEG